MHDCQKIEACLTDLIFAELNEPAKLQALSEIESCEACHAQYLSFKAALAVFDQAADLMLPDETYWSGYEARLQARLATDEKPRLWQRLVEAMRVSVLRPAWAMSVAALIVITLLLWAYLKQPLQPSTLQIAVSAQTLTLPQENPNPKDNPGSSSKNQDRREQKLAQNQQPKKPAIHQPNAPQVAQHNTQSAPKIEKPVQDEFIAANVNALPTLPVISLADEETARHFEKAQLLLRAFRNLNLADSDSKAMLADETERSRALLYQNVLLRREAEARGNLPVRQVLDDLEPVLIDIANLSDSPVASDLRAIRERMQKKEIIPTLQLYSTRTVMAKADFN
ncbi:MAG: hypothetical protein AB1757_23475 [Acidobacteriota bacterium]